MANWGTNTDGSGTNPPNLLLLIGFLILGTGCHYYKLCWTVSGAGSKIIVGDGTNTCAVTVSTSPTWNTIPVEISNAGQIVQNVAITFGSLLVQNGGTLQYNRNGGNIPTATWNSGSTVLISGFTNSEPGGLGQSFWHFTWSCPGQVQSCELQGALTTVNGNFSVTETGGANLG
ncbi:MAG: hypothetical protein IPN68_16925 [Bacteroidetes bacterium]|nr:hypothetical protein [Bacteroidota bacterium]